MQGTLLHNKHYVNLGLGALPPDTTEKATISWLFPYLRLTKKCLFKLLEYIAHLLPGFFLILVYLTGNLLGSLRVFKLPANFQ